MDAHDEDPFGHVGLGMEPFAGTGSRATSWASAHSSSSVVTSQVATPNLFTQTPTIPLSRSASAADICEELLQAARES